MKARGNFQPTLTKPEQTIPMREMVTRYANGMPLHKNENMAWETDGQRFEGIDARRLDYADIQERKLLAKDKVKQINEDIQNAKKRKAEAKPTTVETPDSDVSGNQPVKSDKGDGVQP